MTSLLLNIKQVATTVALSVPQIYKLMRRGEFPRPIYLGAKAPRWVATELEDWIAKRARQRDKEQRLNQSNAA